MQAPSNKPKTDRRWLRSRELLSNAMILLMMEKSYGAITVQDIIEQANVGRSTFYAHYQHKDDLLSNEFERLVAALSADMKRSGDGKALMPSLELFRHVQSHYKLYKALIWSDGLEVVVKSLQRLLADNIEQKLRALAPSQPPAICSMTAAYVAGSFLSLLRWWLDNDLAIPPEQMDDLFQNLILQGIQKTLGVVTQSKEASF